MWSYDSLSVFLIFAFYSFLLSPYSKCSVRDAAKAKTAAAEKPAAKADSKGKSTSNQTGEISASFFYSSAV